MRKLLLCAVMLLGTVCMANAQDKIQFGVRAGMNISSLSGDIENLDSRIGYHVGAVMDWNVAKNLYVQPGLFFTTRGAKSDFAYEEEGVKVSEEMKFNMSYLQIPVSVSYRFPVSEKFKIDVNAGPYFALGIGGKVKAEATASYQNESASEKEEGDIFGDEGLAKRFDAGLRFGAGVHMQKFSLGLIYDLGLSNIANKVEDGSKFKIKNGSFLISLGYNF